MLMSQQPCDSLAVISHPLIQNGGTVEYVIVPVVTLGCLFGVNIGLYKLYATALYRRQNTVCLASYQTGLSKL